MAALFPLQQIHESKHHYSVHMIQTCYTYCIKNTSEKMRLHNSPTNISLLTSFDPGLCSRIFCPCGNSGFVCWCCKRFAVLDSFRTLKLLQPRFLRTAAATTTTTTTTTSPVEKNSWTLYSRLTPMGTASNKQQAPNNTQQRTFTEQPAAKGQRKVFLKNVAINW